MQTQITQVPAVGGSQPAAPGGGIYGPIDLGKDIWNFFGDVVSVDKPKVKLPEIQVTAKNQPANQPPITTGVNGVVQQIAANPVLLVAGLALLIKVMK
jgi:hypothetical protein